MKNCSTIDHVDVILFNKPCDVLCQFTDEQNRANLSNFILDKEFYACGRLDKDSEGLLLLTNNGKFQHLISDPKHKLEKSYWIQVEGTPDNASLELLRNGIELKDGKTEPCSITVIPEPTVSPRIPPIRYRKNQPTSWLKIVLTEGRNRQVRRMTAAIGFPTLRLIRHRIGSWTSTHLASGESRRLEIPFNSLPQRWQRYLLDTKPVSRRRQLAVKNNSRGTPSQRRGRY